jgi:hypothetical protein
MQSVPPGLITLTQPHPHLVRDVLKCVTSSRNDLHLLTFFVINIHDRRGKFERFIRTVVIKQHLALDVLRNRLTKTKVGHEWYQSADLALLIRRLYFFYLFKGTPSFKVDKTGFSV